MLSLSESRWSSSTSPGVWVWDGIQSRPLFLINTRPREHHQRAMLPIPLIHSTERYRPVCIRDVHCGCRFLIADFLNTQDGCRFLIADFLNTQDNASFNFLAVAYVPPYPNMFLYGPIPPKRSKRSRTDSPEGTAPTHRAAFKWPKGRVITASWGGVGNAVVTSVVRVGIGKCRNTLWYFINVLYSNVFHKKVLFT